MKTIVTLDKSNQPHGFPQLDENGKVGVGQLPTLLPVLNVGALSGTTISGGTFYGDGSNLSGIVIDDIHVVSGSVVGYDIILNNSDGSVVTIPGLSDTGKYVESGEIIGTDIYLYQSIGDPVIISGLTDMTGSTVSGGGITGTTIILYQTNGVEPIFISGLTSGSTVTGGLITGNSITLYQVGVDPVEITGLTVSPSGNNTEIQFNDNNSFGSSSAFTYNQNTNSLSNGLDVIAGGKFSHAEGRSTQTSILGYNSTSIVDGVITLDSIYGDVTGEFDTNILFNDSFIGGSNVYGTIISEISSTSYDVISGQTIITLVDVSINGPVAYIGVPYVISPLNADKGINGTGSHSEGNATLAYGNYSHSEGIGTIAFGDYQHVTGKYNTTGNTSSLFVIGNGFNDDNRSDIVLVNQTGVNVNGYMTGNTISGGTFYGNGSGLTDVNLYTNSTPIQTKLGGVLVGNTFSNKTMKEMWDQLLYPYLSPAFTSFSISGATTTKEIGSTLADPSTFQWSASETDNIDEISLISGYAMSNVTSISYSPTNRSVDFLFPVTRTSVSGPGTRDWFLRGLNTNGNFFTSTESVRWDYRMYAGSYTGDTITANIITGLTDYNSIKNGFSGTFNFTGAGYKYFCFADTYASVIQPTSFTSGGFTVPMEDTFVFSQFPLPLSYDLVSVTNTFGESTEYRIYRTKFQIIGAYPIIIS
jgi:hypothetical protein